MMCLVIKKSRMITVLGIVIVITFAVSSAIAAVVNLISNPHSTVSAQMIEKNKNSVMMTVNVYENTDTDVLLSIFRDTDVIFFISEDFCERFPLKVKSIAQSGYQIGILEEDISNLTRNEVYDRLAVRIERMARITGKNTYMVRLAQSDAEEETVKLISSLGLLLLQWTKDGADGRIRGGDIILADEKSAENLLKKISAEGFKMISADEI